MSGFPKKAGQTYLKGPSQTVSECADDISVTTVTQTLVCHVVNALGEELRSTVRHQEVSSTRMFGLEALARRPVSPVITGSGRCAIAH